MFILDNNEAIHKLQYTEGLPTYDLQQRGMPKAVAKEISSTIKRLKKNQDKYVPEVSVFSICNC